MSSNKDYTNMTHEELRSEEKKMKSQKTMTAIFIGFLMGVAIYAAVNGDFILTIILLFFTYRLANGGAQKLKNVQEEISDRDNNH